MARSGSLSLSPALKVLSRTARVSRFRILRRTSVCPPRAVGLETSTSRQWYGASSNSKNIFRLMLIASIRLAIRRRASWTVLARVGISENHKHLGSEFYLDNTRAAAIIGAGGRMKFQEGA